jgi:hypothetical protein
MIAGESRNRRKSRTGPDGVIEDCCERCGTFRPRAMFLSGGRAVCRQCRASRRPEPVGALAPRGNAAAQPTESAIQLLEPGEYTLARGRYAGRRLSEAPVSYLRACASPRPDANRFRTHIRWSADVRMIRNYLEQLDALV